MVKSQTQEYILANAISGAVMSCERIARDEREWRNHLNLTAYCAAEVAYPKAVYVAVADGEVAPDVDA